MNELKHIAINYFDTLLNKKDVLICDQLLSSDYTDNDAPNAPMGPQETKDYVRQLLIDYPNLSIKIEDAFGEGNKVVLRLIWYGIHKDTNEVFHVMGNIILEFNDKGQIYRRWSAYKNL